MWGGCTTWGGRSGRGGNGVSGGVGGARSAPCGRASRWWISVVWKHGYGRTILPLMAPLERRFAADTVHLALALFGVGDDPQPPVFSAHLALALPGKRVVGLVVLSVDLHNCIHLGSLQSAGRTFERGLQPAGLVRGCNPTVACPTLARCGAGGAEAQFAGQPMGQVSPLLKPTCAWVRAAVFSACRSLWPAKGLAVKLGSKGLQKSRPRCWSPRCLPGPQLGAPPAPRPRPHSSSRQAKRGSCMVSLCVFQERCPNVGELLVALKATQKENRGRRPHRGEPACSRCSRCSSHWTDRKSMKRP